LLALVASAGCARASVPRGDALPVPAAAPDHHRNAEDGAEDGAKDGASAAGAAPSIATGEALLQEALAKRARGDAAGSQRLLDRARIVLERATAETAVFEPREGIWDVSAMAWSGDGGELAVAAASGIYLFHGDGRDEALRLHADTQPVRGIAISADARTLVSAGVDQDPQVWDLVSARRTRTLHRPEEMVGETLSSLSFSPDGTKVAGRAWGNAWPTVWKLHLGRRSARRTFDHVVHGIGPPVMKSDVGAGRDDSCIVCPDCLPGQRYVENPRGTTTR
jgi:hypothetical protein